MEFASKNLTVGELNAIVKKLGGEAGARALLRDETRVVPIEIAAKKEIPASIIIHVDRLIRPMYPDWVMKVMHPELENTGPTDYDLAKDVSLCERKNGGVTTCNVIYSSLKQHGIKSCGNLQDALAIQKLDAATFRKVFGNNSVYFWKSVVQDRIGRHGVPYLRVRRGEVVLIWDWVDDDWYDHKSVLRFVK